MKVQRLIMIRLAARDPQALAAFYVGALGFAPQSLGRETAVVALDERRIEIARTAGETYPMGLPPWSPLFQHVAIATPDLAAALDRLARSQGWRPISQGGPQILPASSGGAAAFKFRDPEGHPLELIAFPGSAGVSRARIDHSAISVADSAASLAFYEGLGLSPGARTLNQGPEQERLDGLASAEVEVTALELPGGGAHVELLCYRGHYPRVTPPAAPDAVAATRLVMTMESPRALDGLEARLADRVERPGPPLLLRDPDGHLLQFEPAAITGRR